MNYDHWKSEGRSAAGLFLDPQNPRIPPSPKPLSQRELIEELVLHDDVLELAKTIAANGFFPNEPLVAVKEKEGVFVVEGNRRLTACKLLLEPALAPTSFQTRFRTLSATIDPKHLGSIPTLVAPSRDAAIPLIIARHTAVQISKWQPAMQANYYHSLIQNGLTLEEVANRFHLQPSEIKSELVSHNLYSMARRLKLPDEVCSVVRDPRKFKLTTLTRIFDTPATKEFFGINYSDSGGIVGNVDPSEFNKGFSKIVSDVAGGKADSRTLNSPKEIKSYLDGFNSSEKPNLKIKGVFDSSKFMVDTSPIALPLKKTKAVVRSALNSKYLLPKTIVCRSSNQRVLELFSELRKLSPSAFPNACTFAFRCFVELSVFCYLDAKGEIAKMKAEYQADLSKRNSKLPANQKKRVIPPHWTPDLSQMLKWLIDPARNVLPQGHITKALTQAVHDEKDFISLNLVVHNSAYPASETRLRETYSRLEEFLKVILAQP